MESNNLLTGGIEELKAYRELVQTANNTKAEQAAMRAEQKQLEKELNQARKNLKDAKESTVKKRRSELAGQFNSQINKESGKLKKAQNARGKAKAAGVKDRIGNETAELSAQNKEIKTTIRKMLKEEKLPAFAGGDAFFSLYFTKGFGEVMFCILTIVAVFLLLPGLITYLFCHFVFHDQYLAIIAALCYFVIIVLGFLIYILIGNATKQKHNEKLREIRTLRDSLHQNEKQIKKIAKSIKKDTNEEMYGLGEYDNKIANVEGTITGIEEGKATALKQFDEVTAPQIERELDARDLPHIEELEKSLAAATDRLEDLDKACKESDIRLSTEYEAYLGKGFSDVAEIDELIGLLERGEATTIGDAVNAYKNRK